jgi:glutathione S-transferase
MDFPYPYAALGTGLVILLYAWTGITVGRARRQYGVDYPNTVGSDDFNRVYRAHANTHEALTQFIPALWLFALILSDIGAGLLALVWTVGRILYVKGYAVAAEKRTTGFTIGLLAAATALFAPLALILWQLAT